MMKSGENNLTGPTREVKLGNLGCLDEELKSQSLPDASLRGLPNTMFSFLWREPANRSSRGLRTRERGSVPLTVEELEERCVLSADTTVAAPNSPFPFTAPGDVQVASQPKGNPGIVFLGDSITWGFANGLGAPVWSAVMAPLSAADYGVSGQTTQSLLFQLSLGQLVGINPSVVVLTIGTNNLLEGDTPQATAAGVLADVYAIHQYLPGAHVLVLGTPPGGANPTDPYRLQTEQTDALVQSMLADDPRAAFVNIAPALEQPDGTISSAVLIDSIHPTALGYFNLINALAVPLEQTASVNIAPPLASLQDTIPHDTLPFAISLAIPALPETLSFPAIPVGSAPSATPPPGANVVLAVGQPDGKVANWLLSADAQSAQGIPGATTLPNAPASSLPVTPAFEQPLGKLANGALSDPNQPMRSTDGLAPALETLVNQKAATVTTSL
jgi:beta-glucosidase